MQVTVHAAKTQLSKLIEAALRGEEVIIARGSEPVVQLVAIPKTTFKIGLLEGQVAGSGPDFFEPMNAEELALWEGER
ncbi:type II toxin-antitoxin system prevent-host-death family antitoxin [Methylobacterium sp. WL103]|uniref:type II toxin-antitoxin system Phd/YefM family antitoxin n=1 Tax=unclassified Methylobacterium TaxID=2615210 RepID=UPI0011CCD0B4|nr:MULTISPECIES: type II toxin-antitoxin system Phd/YefM family antitoxin [unclassified Methylobacterium]TXM68706.1 type II toxin-antitoxin system prevent-host-death family antitoxin [Methylobacterium sp. WL12]TXN02084.1 type II toxin-antitoxin system prevent-host-death family antitoxin [Methylobacterium sp. WL103]